MSRQAAALVLDILSDPVARLPSFGVGDAARLSLSRGGQDGHEPALHRQLGGGDHRPGSPSRSGSGNFNGRPMQGVGGITGAGPLLHRAALLVAQRYPPGVLPPLRRPVRSRSVSAGSRGSARGPTALPMTEWFVPGTEPARPCDWHRGGRVVLPAEYAEWAADAPQPGVPARDRRRCDCGADRFRILSPQDGDRYSVPVGGDPRYATIALRASGAATGPGCAGSWTAGNGAKRGGALVPGPPHRARGQRRAGRAT